jgi:hypothetical protein
MTNEQEDDIIHGLVDLMQHHAVGYGLEDSSTQHLKFDRNDIEVLIRRLQGEQLILKRQGNYITPSPLGIRTARSNGGYRASQKKTNRDALLKKIQEWLSASGSIIGGAAGVAGLALSLCTIYLNNRDTEKSDHTYEQLSTHLASLEKEVSRLRAQNPKPLVLPIVPAKPLLIPPVQQRRAIGPRVPLPQSQ